MRRGIAAWIVSMVALCFASATDSKQPDAAAGGGRGVFLAY